MKRFAFVAFSFLLAGCSIIQLKKPTVSELVNPVELTPMKQRVEFTTDDGVLIIGHWYPVENARRVVLLLHMMPATKESWEELARELNKRDIAALAIDLRGHGESVTKGVGGTGVGSRERQKIHFQSFTDQEHQESIRDVRAAVAWLTSQGFDVNQILLGGASIGANLALQFESEMPEIPRVVLLSPGLDYRGVKTEPAIVGLTPDSLLLIIAAQDDEYASESSKILKDRRPSIELSIVDGSAHGTDLFDEHPETLTRVADFLSQ